MDALIKEKLRLHKLFLDGDIEGVKADFYAANARHIDLRRADLRRADFGFADLRFADLRFADLRFADLRSADLSGVNLEGAQLHGAIIDSKYLIHDDTARGYKLYRLPCAEDMYVAGCRAFTKKQALEHWGSAAHRQDAYVKAILTA